ncbi:chemotaxis protein CheW5 [[Clostridium] cellulosi]|uniref:Chemotaxis protein CheW5 n=1 Tax=[Clostridium] cellulosi TaxID=29343 RepID=A0A078KK67_9FIRM|nr:MAG: chemotaxis protein CheW [[Clostridium] cellulosi]CDZ24071.1 chemotaxis protein CheW5 [[Clostridium] cellulosi]
MNDLIETNDEVQEEDLQHGRYLTFSLDNEVFGIEISYVNEIVGMQKINDVPEVSNFVKGIINLRGNIIPVIDMRIKFKKQPCEYDERTCIIIVNINGISAGLIVDKVAEVISIEDSEIAPPPDFRTGFQSRYINGIGKLKDKVVLLIDCDKLFRDDELEEITAEKEKAEIQENENS